PAGERHQRHLSLDAGERRADAVMQAAAEAEMGVTLPIGIEAVGIWKAIGIAAARREGAAPRASPSGSSPRRSRCRRAPGACGNGPEARSAAAPRPGAARSRVWRVAARDAQDGAIRSACRW